MLVFLYVWQSDSEGGKTNQYNKYKFGFIRRKQYYFKCALLTNKVFSRKRTIGYNPSSCSKLLNIVNRVLNSSKTPNIIYINQKTHQNIQICLKALKK